MCADIGNLHTSLEFACPLFWFPSPAQISYPPKDPDDSFLDLGLAPVPSLSSPNLNQNLVLPHPDSRQRFLKKQEFVSREVMATAAGPTQVTNRKCARVGAHLASGVQCLRQLPPSPRAPGLRT